MAENRKDVKRYVCPSCFAREIDLELAYDPADEEYYCTRCTYNGTETEIKEFYAYYAKTKYKLMKAKYEG